MAITPIRKVQGTNDALGGLLGIAQSASPLLNLIPVVGPGLAAAAPPALGIARGLVTDPNKKPNDLDKVSGPLGSVSQMAQGIAGAVEQTPAINTVAGMDHGAMLLNIDKAQTALNTMTGIPEADALSLNQQFDASKQKLLKIMNYGGQ